MTLPEIMNAVPPELWETVRAASAKSTERLAGSEWWNNKYYLDTPHHDGFAEQSDSQGSREIPYERELFHPSSYGRFGLGPEGPVAYFSSDFGANCCETIPELRDDPSVTGADLLAYLRGESRLLQGKYGYPMAVHVTGDSILLDMHSPSRLLLSFVVERGPWETDRAFVQGVLRSWDPDMRRQTQAIAIAAEQNGFNGVVYSSVRIPHDLWMPNVNLVMFRRENVIV